MTSGIKIVTVIASVTAISAVIGLVAGHFHLSQTFESAAIGVVIGMGVALGAFSVTPKDQNAPECSRRKIG